MHLIDLGWNSSFETSFQQFKGNRLIPARIVEEHKNRYVSFCEQGEFISEVSGKFRHEAETKVNYPTVGDWVAISLLEGENRAIIHDLLPRQSAFIRKEAGKQTKEQVVAANVDMVFVVCGLDGNFNVRRVERYLTLAWESGAMPVILLNKCDLSEDLEMQISEMESSAIGVPIHAISAADGRGFESITGYFAGAKTSAFLGSSGVGKSSIINRLLGEERLPTGDVSGDESRGRHTTTYRQLIVLPSGGLVIDTPGMRELQVWDDEEGLRQAFDDIEQFAQNCRFRDCEHQSEPGCSVQAAIKSGELERERFESYVKLKKEIRYLETRLSMKASAVEKLRWKKIAQLQRNFKKGKGL